MKQIPYIYELKKHNNDGMDTWNPSQYEKFRSERTEAFLDLLALVEPRPGLSAIDLGCGTGELTSLLHSRTQAGSTLGIDTSDAMLGQSKARARQGLEFRKLSIERAGGAGRFDLVFSNAALHWVDDHAATLRGLKALLKPGGQLAVQIPANHDHASHRIAAEVAGLPGFKDCLKGYVRVSPVLAPEEYALMLYELGFQRQSVRLQVYLHELPNADGVVEWVKGSLLTEYERRLSPEKYQEFVSVYRARCVIELGRSEPYAYVFKRILFWGSLS